MTTPTLGRKPTICFSLRHITARLDTQSNQLALFDSPTETNHSILPAQYVGLNGVETLKSLCHTLWENGYGPMDERLEDILEPFRKKIADLEAAARLQSQKATPSDFLQEQYRKLSARSEKTETALNELVKLKRMKETWEASEHKDLASVIALKAEYESQKEKAWEYAKALVDG